MYWSPENKSQCTGLLKTEPIYWSPGDPMISVFRRAACEECHEQSGNKAVLPFCTEAIKQVFQTSASKIGTLQHDVRILLRRFLSNFIKPELLAVTTNEELHNFDYATIRNQVSNDELGIGTAARLHLIGMSDELESTQREKNFFFAVRQLYVECVRKIVEKFPSKRLA